MLDTMILRLAVRPSAGGTPEKPATHIMLLTKLLSTADQQLGD